MPSIRCWAKNDDIDKLIQGFKHSVLHEAHEATAMGFALSMKDIEALWLEPPEIAVNAIPVNIEILYSEKDNFHPTQQMKEALAIDILNRMQFIGFPLKVAAVAVWVRPQKDAVFMIRNL